MFAATKRNYALIGQLLAQREPEIASLLIRVWLPCEPLENDCTKIKDLFISFCSIHGIEPEDYRGSLYKSGKVEMRKLFISCILRLYYPQVYEMPDNRINTKNLISQISEVLKQDKGNVSKMVREVIVLEKAYDDYRASVNDTMEKLKIAG